jgi:hypothetical protein
MQVVQIAPMQGWLTLRHQPPINTMLDGAKTGAGTVRAPQLRIETPTSWQGQYSEIAGIFSARRKYSELTACKLARPERFELPTPWFVGRPSITAKLMIYMVFIAPKF